MSKPFTHICFECANGIPYDNETAGREIGCPYCGNHIRLGESSGAVAEEAEASPWSHSDEEDMSDDSQRRGVRAFAIIIAILLVAGGGWASWWFGFRQVPVEPGIKLVESTVESGSEQNKSPQPESKPPSVATETNAPATTNAPPPVDWRTFIGTYRRNPSENSSHTGIISWVGLSDSGKPILKWRNLAGAEWPLYPTPKSWKVRTGKGNPHLNTAQGNHFVFRPGEGTNRIPAGFEFNQGFFMRIILAR